MSPSASAVLGRQIVLASRPAGKPTAADFRLEEAPLAAPGDGEVLLAVRHLSLDPYMRGKMDDRKSYSPPTPIGGVMEGEVVAEVVESRHPDYAGGSHVLGRLGWRTHALSDGTGLTKLDARFDPLTTALGVMGMPGFTAYSGLLSIGRPQVGETVVVAAASGPVGSLVGQIARIKGARAVGIAGGPDKCRFVRDELGFDAVVDHREANFARQLAEACPSGVDVYFENVGGELWQAVLPLLNKFARVPVCGLIAQYNGGGSTGPDRLAQTMREVLSRSVTLRGFINTEFAAQRSAFLDDVSGWIADGRVRHREDIVVGLDHAPEAFMGMLEGRNFGKLLVEMT